MIEEVKYKCPRCGSEKRWVQAILEEEKAAGRISEAISVGMLGKLEIPVTEPNAKPYPGKEVAIVARFDDICYDCGQTYTFMVRYHMSKWSLDISHLVKPQKPSDMQFNPKMFRGDG